MQNPRTGLRWVVAAIASIGITTFAPGHAASVAPVAAENGMVVSAQHLATKVGWMCSNGAATRSTRR